MPPESFFADMSGATMDHSLSVIPETQPDESKRLGDEIESIRNQIKSFSSRRSVLSSALLTSSASQNLSDQTSSSKNTRHTPNFDPKSILRTRAREATNLNLQNLHRMCAGVTMFETHDPDPYAVDGGKVLGVRIEAFCRGTKDFLSPYYLLLNHPNPESSALRVHRHTVPPSIPLSQLAAKYLPEAPSTLLTPGKHPRPQNLPRLVQELRREIVSYHRRQDAVKQLQNEIDLRVRGTASGNVLTNIKEVRSADAEVTDIRIEWREDQLGKLKIDKCGRIEKAVVMGSNRKRRKSLERMLMSRDGHLSNLSALIQNIEVG